MTTSRRLAPQQRHQGTWAGLVVASVVLAFLASCGSAHPPKVGTASTTTTVGAPSDQAVLAAYTAATYAMAAAEVHADPNWPALLTTVTNPELAHVQTYIRASQELGYRVQGSVRLLNAKVTALSATSAQVSACVADNVIAHLANGQPAPGAAGQASFDVADGTLVPVGSTWVLQDGTDRQYSTAQAGGPLCAG